MMERGKKDRKREQMEQQKSKQPERGKQAEVDVGGAQFRGKQTKDRGRSWVATPCLVSDGRASERAREWARARTQRNWRAEVLPIGQGLHLHVGHRLDEHRRRARGEQFIGEQ